MAISYCNSLSSLISFHWGKICLIRSLVMIELTQWLFISVLKVNCLLCQQSNQEPAHTHFRWLSSPVYRFLSMLHFFHFFYIASFSRSVSLSLNLSFSYTYCNAKQSRLLVSRVPNHTVTTVKILYFPAQGLQLTLISSVNTQWHLFAIVIFLSHNQVPY